MDYIKFLSDSGITNQAIIDGIKRSEMDMPISTNSNDAARASVIRRANMIINTAIESMTESLAYINKKEK